MAFILTVFVSKLILFFFFLLQKAQLGPGQSVLKNEAEHKPSKGRQEGERLARSCV